MEIFIHKHALATNQDELNSMLKACGPSNRRAWVLPRIQKLIQKWTSNNAKIEINKLMCSLENIDDMLLIARRWNNTIQQNAKISIDMLNQANTEHALDTAFCSLSDYTNKWTPYARHAVFSDTNTMPDTMLNDDNYLSIVKHPNEWLFCDITILT